MPLEWRTQLKRVLWTLSGHLVWRQIFSHKCQFRKNKMFRIKWKQWQTLFSWAPKSLRMVIAAMKFKDTCSLEEKLDNILKSRDITLPTKVLIVKAMVFPVVMYGCESWTIKKAEHWRIDALNCGAGEDSWESLVLQGDPTCQSSRKSVLNIHWKDWC